MLNILLEIICLSVQTNYKTVFNCLFVFCLYCYNQTAHNSGWMTELICRAFDELDMHFISHVVVSQDYIIMMLLFDILGKYFRCQGDKRKYIETKIRMDMK